MERITIPLGAKLLSFLIVLLIEDRNDERYSKIFFSNDIMKIISQEKNVMVYDNCIYLNDASCHICICREENVYYLNRLISRENNIHYEIVPQKSFDAFCIITA